MAYGVPTLSRVAAIRSREAFGQWTGLLPLRLCDSRAGGISRRAIPVRGERAPLELEQVLHSGAGLGPGDAWQQVLGRSKASSNSRT